MHKISVVIPAFDEEKYIPHCLEALERYRTKEIEEIIVVDNNSTDRTAEVARGFAGVTVVLEKRKGVSFARDRGAKMAKGDIIAFLDADTRITKGWAKRLLYHFQNPTIVCVSGPAIFYDIAKYKQWLVSAYWHVARWTIYPFTKYMGYFLNLAVRKDALEKIGGIDTSVRFYGDDTNLTRRISKVGKVIFDLKFLVYTSGRRLEQEGFISTGWNYVKSFFAEAVLDRPLDKDYTETR